jgi:5'-3' exonuclease
MLRPDLNLSHRTYIYTYLISFYKNVQSQLLSDLPEMAKISIVLDGWQSPFKKPFLTITAYYITSD